MNEQLVARVVVDTPLPHLDRLFDYRIPAELSDQVRFGVRVRVRFAGRRTDAWVLQRASTSDHRGELAAVERVVGTVAPLTPRTAGLVRAVADRSAGSFADVMRLAVPPRHARAETAPVRRAPVAPAAAPAPSTGWSNYRAGSPLLDAVAAGRPARAVWSALPGEQWTARLAEAVEVAVRSGRGAIVVVPDARDLLRLEPAVAARVGAHAMVSLSAQLGPERRYRRWLAARRGEVRVVLGTRAAAYAPVVNLGLVVIWDDADDLHAEPRAPYPHVREVLGLRSAMEGAALIIGGHARSVEAQHLLETGWAHEVIADRAVVRAKAPRVVVAGDDAELARDPAARSARLPTLAWRTAHTALADGRPVLIQVPRRGYVPALGCSRDHIPARCAHCHGPLSLAGAGAVPVCRWCARSATGWRCPRCGGGRLQAMVTGAARTAEELGRAFPGTVVKTSGAGAVLTEVEAAPALVVATPGAEPVAVGGYGAALLLDGWALLGRPDLRAAEEAVRRWSNAIALVAAEGTVVVTADPAVPAVQALVRWDPAGFAARELAERAELGFPPTARVAGLTGPSAAVAELLSEAVLPGEHTLIGPVEVAGGAVRVLVIVPLEHGVALAAALKAAAAVRSARKASDPVRLQLDPPEFG